MYQTDIPHSHQEVIPHPGPHPGPHPEPHPEPHPGPHPEPHPEPHPVSHSEDVAYSLSHLQDQGPQSGPYPKPHPAPHPGDVAYSLSRTHQGHAPHMQPHPGPRPGNAVYSLSQESVGLDLQQLQPEQETNINRHSSSVLTYGAVYECDTHKRALDSITYDGLEYLRRSQEAGSPRQRVGKGYDINHQDWGGNYHGYRHELPKDSSSDFLDLITGSHDQTLLTSHPHSNDSLLPFAASSYQERLCPLTYDPTQYQLTDDGTSGHRRHDDDNWLIQQDLQGRSKVYDHEKAKMDCTTYEKELLLRQWKGQLKRGRDSDSDSPVWLPTFVSPLQKPRLESPSPPKLYPQRMF